jgi:hypothetical protein
MAFTITVENASEEKTLGFDEVDMVVDGAASAEVNLYSGSPIIMHPGDRGSEQVSFGVPPTAPKGAYTVTVNVYLYGERLAFDSFDMEVSDDCGSGF